MHHEAETAAQAAALDATKATKKHSKQSKGSKKGADRNADMDGCDESDDDVDVLGNTAHAAGMRGDSGILLPCDWNELASRIASRLTFSMHVVEPTPSARTPQEIAGGATPSKQSTKALQPLQAVVVHCLVVVVVRL